MKQSLYLKLEDIIWCVTKKQYIGGSVVKKGQIVEYFDKLYNVTKETGYVGSVNKFKYEIEEV